METPILFVNFFNAEHLWVARGWIATASSIWPTGYIDVQFPCLIAGGHMENQFLTTQVLFWGWPWMSVPLRRWGHSSTEKNVLWYVTMSYYVDMSLYITQMRSMVLEYLPTFTPYLWPGFVVCKYSSTMGCIWVTHQLGCLSFEKPRYIFVAPWRIRLWSPQACWWLMSPIRLVVMLL